MKKSKYIILALGLAVLPVFSTIGVLAEGNSSTLMVSPPNQEIILIPGETYDGSIKVSNSNEAENDLVYSVSVGTFGQKKSDDSEDDYGTVDMETVTSYNQMMDWIKLGKENGVVAPNESDVVPFSIVVPADAPAGGQYATINIQDDTKRGDTNGNVTIESKARIASIIYAEVAGETRDEGVILENDIPSLLLNNTLEAGSMVRNNGNVHTDAEYILQVWPLFSDEEVCTNEEEPETSLVLPETEKYHTETCQLPSVGIFRAKQTVKIFGEESTVEKMVIVCPIWLLFIIFFVVAGLVIWIVMRVKARGKKSEKKSEKKAEE